MSNELHSPIPPGNDANLQFQAETDALLAKVSEQVDLEIFDPHDEELLTDLVERLGDPRGLIRLRVATTLGEIGEPATPFLMTALASHENVVVRRAAGKTLTIIADPRAVPTLVHALLNDEDTVVQGSAVGALARMGAASVPVLLEILGSPDQPESTKGHVAWALSFIGSEAKSYLYREIDSDSPAIRAAVVGAITKIVQENPEEDVALNLLIRSLKDTEAMVRCEAAAALGNLTYRPARVPLLDLLHHPDWESRKSAALALMKLGDKQSISDLEAALAQESETSVQTILKLAISQLDKKSNLEDW
ncbi:HEAT repeat domain-containing protein [Chamaesiphon sp. VAR_48_metabat_135_sub]|uniref:HEAT repeat domain-containing protein n=1 Tax=Chamaesiphon sp. VAR_48_metabat_135_sub TaxID=2964699 RepID=UPI00286A8AAC|nr:HEAT repeat domain-containing protein [Chamaesiphon sp. VAR_48_metabat_135_sub]